MQLGTLLCWNEQCNTVQARRRFIHFLRNHTGKSMQQIGKIQFDRLTEAPIKCLRFFYAFKYIIMLEQTFQYRASQKKVYSLLAKSYRKINETNW